MAAAGINLLCLPDEMLAKIAENLSISDWHRMSLTCQRLKTIVEGKTFRTNVLSEGDLVVPDEVLRRHWKHDTGYDSRKQQALTECTAFLTARSSSTFGTYKF